MNNIHDTKTDMGAMGASHVAGRGQSPKLLLSYREAAAPRGTLARGRP